MAEAIFASRSKHKLRHDQDQAECGDVPAKGAQPGNAPRIQWKKDRATSNVKQRSCRAGSSAPIQQVDHQHRCDEDRKRLKKVPLSTFKPTSKTRWTYVFVPWTYGIAVAYLRLEAKGGCGQVHEREHHSRK